MRIVDGRKDRADILLVVRVLLEFLVIGIVQYLELLLNGRSLPPAHCAATRVLLLFLHLAQNRLFFYLDQRFAFVFSKG